MNKLKDALNRIIWLQSENIKVGGGLFDVYSNEYISALVSAIKKNISGTWNILRNGTDEEFSELLNWLDEVGGEFDDDEGCKKIISIARNRGTNTAIDAAKLIFPKRFDQFWNESEPITEPATKTRTFRQVVQPPV